MHQAPHAPRHATMVMNVDAMVDEGAACDDGSAPLKRARTAAGSVATAGGAASSAATALPPRLWAAWAAAAGSAGAPSRPGASAATATEDAGPLGERRLRRAAPRRAALRRASDRATSSGRAADHVADSPSAPVRSARSAAPPLGEQQPGAAPGGRRARAAAPGRGRGAARREPPPRQQRLAERQQRRRVAQHVAAQPPPADLAGGPRAALAALLALTERKVTACQARLAEAAAAHAPPSVETVAALARSLSARAQLAAELRRPGRADPEAAPGLAAARGAQPAPRAAAPRRAPADPLAVWGSYGGLAPSDIPPGWHRDALAGLAPIIPHELLAQTAAGAASGGAPPALLGNVSSRLSSSAACEALASAARAAGGGAAAAAAPASPGAACPPGTPPPAPGCLAGRGDPFGEVDTLLEGMRSLGALAATPPQQAAAGAPPGGGGAGAEAQRPGLRGSGVRRAADIPGLAEALRAAASKRARVAGGSPPAAAAGGEPAEGCPAAAPSPFTRSLERLAVGEQAGPSEQPRVQLPLPLPLPGHQSLPSPCEQPPDHASGLTAPRGNTQLLKLRWLLQQRAEAERAAAQEDAALAAGQAARTDGAAPLAAEAPRAPAAACSVSGGAPDAPRCQLPAWLAEAVESRLRASKAPGDAGRPSEERGSEAPGAPVELAPHVHGPTPSSCSTPMLPRQASVPASPRACGAGDGSPRAAARGGSDGGCSPTATVASELSFHQRDAPRAPAAAAGGATSSGSSQATAPAGLSPRDQATYEALRAKLRGVRRLPQPGSARFERLRRVWAAVQARGLLTSLPGEALAIMARFDALAAAGGRGDAPAPAQAGAGARVGAARRGKRAAAGDAGGPDGARCVKCSRAAAWASGERLCRVTAGLSLDAGTTTATAPGAAACADASRGLAAAGAASGGEPCGSTATALTTGATAPARAGAGGDCGAAPGLDKAGRGGDEAEAGAFASAAMQLGGRDDAWDERLPAVPEPGGFASGLSAGFGRCLLGPGRPGGARVISGMQTLVVLALRAAGSARLGAGAARAAAAAAAAAAVGAAPPRCGGATVAVAQGWSTAAVGAGVVGRCRQWPCGGATAVARWWSSAAGGAGPAGAEGPAKVARTPHSQAIALMLSAESLPPGELAAKLDALCAQLEAELSSAGGGFSSTELAAFAEACRQVGHTHRGVFAVMLQRLAPAAASLPLDELPSLLWAAAQLADDDRSSVTGSSASSSHDDGRRTVRVPSNDGVAGSVASARLGGHPGLLDFLLGAAQVLTADADELPSEELAVVAAALAALETRDPFLLTALAEAAMERTAELSEGELVGLLSSFASMGRYFFDNRLLNALAAEVVDRAGRGAVGDAAVQRAAAALAGIGHRHAALEAAAAAAGARAR
ncbi:hypothetical protein HT031_005283 [Scenedesmus sp. PABB004]|nr:hypothetical protein HT031_005283 [Scenedesmus sp. PABB004]